MQFIRRGRGSVSTVKGCIIYQATALHREILFSPARSAVPISISTFLKQESTTNTYLSYVKYHSPDYGSCLDTVRERSRVDSTSSVRDLAGYTFAPVVCIKLSKLSHDINSQMRKVFGFGCSLMSSLSVDPLSYPLGTVLQYRNLPLGGRREVGKRRYVKWIRGRSTAGLRVELAREWGRRKNGSSSPLPPLAVLCRTPTLSQDTLW